jgi:poly(3-hydroxybutyrate) depolymerase
MRAWLVAFVMLAACKQRATVTGERAVPGCGVSIVPPAGFYDSAGQPHADQLMMQSETGALLVGCLQKIKSNPTTLEQQANRLLDQVAKAQPSLSVRAADASALGTSLKRSVALADLTAGPITGALMVTESAKSMYWVLYTSTHADNQQRERLFASFRVTDADADRGPPRWWHPALALDQRTLGEARSAFQTTAHDGRPAKGFSGAAAPVPPPQVFSRIDVKGSQGKLTAYVTPDPRDGKKHPAVIWAHGGFGDIGSEFWDPAPRSNDQSARAFRDAGIVLAVGSWRAENDNPGDYQLYYGEVDDYLALRDHVATLPYVDPDRIYLAGHSAGGTLVLLASELSSHFRAAFSIGGIPALVSKDLYDRYGGVPFDWGNDDERHLRSAAPFVRSIQRPVFYFEGAGTSAPGSAQWMEDQAAKLNVPFHAYVARYANHFTILAPLTELIAQKILADTGPTTNISFTQREIDGLEFDQPAD